MWQLEADGLAFLDDTISQAEIQDWARSLAVSLDASQRGTLTSAGQVYGSRNLLQTWPRIRDVYRHPILVDYVSGVLGIQAGLVRALYFDKPLGKSWSLPWHRDLTIAVSEHLTDGNDAAGFRCPTTKSGIPHMEAPRQLLEKMLTLRIHLDPSTQANGPVVVVPGSHRHDEPKSDSDQIEKVLCNAGTVLAMRPLISHSSLQAQHGNQDSRRILHLEYAAERYLPGDYQWHTFWPLSD